MRWLNVFLLAAVAGQAPQLPPPFPRPGTTQLLENDAVAVWNVSWLKQQYPLHRTSTIWLACRTSRAIASSHKGTLREGWSPPRPGCFKRTAPMSPMWRKARATRPCGQC